MDKIPRPATDKTGVEWAQWVIMHHILGYGPLLSFDGKPLIINEVAVAYECLNEEAAKHGKDTKKAVSPKRKVDRRPK